MLATEGFRPNRLSVLVAGPINTVLLHHDHLMRADMMARVLRVVGRAGRHVDPLRRQMFRGRMDWLRHRSVARTTCALWHGLGHAGSVYMDVVYPTAFSDTAFPLAAGRAEGQGFRLVDLCAIE